LPYEFAYILCLANFTKSAYPEEVLEDIPACRPWPPGPGLFVVRFPPDGNWSELAGGPGYEAAFKRSANKGFDKTR
jgi:hypothetical protein